MFSLAGTLTVKSIFQQVAMGFIPMLFKDKIQEGLHAYLRRHLKD